VFTLSALVNFVLNANALTSAAHHTNKSELAVEFDFLEQFQAHADCGMTGRERESSTTSSPHSTEFDDCHLIGLSAHSRKHVARRGFICIPIAMQALGAGKFQE
jgi:hypothetical protein